MKIESQVDSNAKNMKLAKKNSNDGKLDDMGLP